MALVEHQNNSGHLAAAETAEQKRERIAAQARLNGSKSQGPTSPAGKKNSSRNSVRHGLTANEHTVLTTESLKNTTKSTTPSSIPCDRPTKAEMRMVEKLANLDWRLERFVIMETCVLNMGAQINVDAISARFERIDGIGIIVEAWQETQSASHCLDLLRRYLGTLQNQFNSTLRNFRDLEKHRLARTQGGLNLDKEWSPPYKAPSLKTLLPSRVEPAKSKGPILVPPTRPVQDEPVTRE